MSVRGTIYCGGQRLPQTGRTEGSRTVESWFVMMTRQRKMADYTPEVGIQDMSPV